MQTTDMNMHIVSHETESALMCNDGGRCQGANIYTQERIESVATYERFRSC